MPASGEMTKLVPATKGGTSLRTTVPLWIIKQFGLKAHDSLQWRLDVEGNAMVVKVTPVKADGEQPQKKRRKGD